MKGNLKRKRTPKKDISKGMISQKKDISKERTSQKKEISTERISRKKEISKEGNLKERISQKKDISKERKSKERELKSKNIQDKHCDVGNSSIVIYYPPPCPLGSMWSVRMPQTCRCIDSL